MKEKIEKAGELGKKARQEGRVCVPAHDPELMEILKQSKKFGDGIPVLKAWTTAWKKEHFETVGIT
ncbi:MAG: hypothetical protein ACXVCY_04535 [Pseudobdellovibrionaceae bacterium]